MDVADVPHANTVASCLGLIASYWYTVIGALIGSGFTVWFAYRQQEKNVINRTIDAKGALIERLEFNNDRLKQTIDQLKNKEIPNYPFDTTGIIIWLARAYDLFDTKLIDSINWHRYQLDHLNSKLSIGFSTCPNHLLIGIDTMQTEPPETFASHVYKTLCAGQRLVSEIRSSDQIFERGAR